MRIQTVFLSGFILANLLALVLSSSANAKGLRRADLVIGGSSCASCLIRIEKKIKASPGVVKAMVSVYRPYSAVVVYDSAKTSMAEINKAIVAERAKAEHIVDAPIKEVPALLLPAGK